MILYMDEIVEFLSHYVSKNYNFREKIEFKYTNVNIDTLINTLNKISMDKNKDIGQFNNNDLYYAGILIFLQVSYSHGNMQYYIDHFDKYKDFCGFIKIKIVNNTISYLDINKALYCMIMTETYNESIYIKNNIVSPLNYKTNNCDLNYDKNISCTDFLEYLVYILAVINIIIVNKKFKYIKSAK